MSDQELRPVGSIAIPVRGWHRGIAWVVMFLALGFGGWLAWKNYNGIGTASVFAIALLFGIVALGGVLPTSIKVGDVQLAIQNAAAQGLVKGAEAAREVASGGEPERLADEAVTGTLPPSVQAEVKQQVVQSLSEVAEARDSTKYAQTAPGRAEAEDTAGRPRLPG